MRSYRAYVEAQQPRNPCLVNLCRFLSGSASARNTCRISCLEFFRNGVKPIQRGLDANSLDSELQRPNADRGSIVRPDAYDGISHLEAQRFGTNDSLGKVLVVEDLTRDVIEVLGSNLDIDPLFFASHIDAPLGERLTKPPNIAFLPSRARLQNYVNIHYQRAHVFPTSGFRQELLRDTNVRRKVTILPSAKGARVGLAQHCCSVLLKFQKGRGWLGLILVDPAITDRYLLTGRDQEQQSVNLPSELFLGGYEDFLNAPSFLDDGNGRHGPARRGLLEDLAYYWSMRLPDHFEAEAPTLLTLSFYPLNIITAEWMIYLEVMFQDIKEYEYSSEHPPDFRGELDKLKSALRVLRSWRRRSIRSQQKIRAMARFIKSHEDAHAECWASLVEDCDYLAASVEDCGRRLENMVPVVTSLVQIVDIRRSFAETANISRVTILALVFMPLTFVSSLFSMNADHSPGGQHFWVYIAVAAPVTIVVFLIARPPVEEARSLRNRLKSLRQPSLPY